MHKQSTWKYRLFRVLQVFCSMVLAIFVLSSTPKDNGYVKNIYTVVDSRERLDKALFYGSTGHEIKMFDCFSDKNLPSSIQEKCLEKLSMFKTKYLNTFVKNELQRNDPQTIKKAMLAASTLKETGCPVLPKPSESRKEAGSASWVEFQEWLELCQWYSSLSIQDKDEVTNINSVIAERKTEFVEGRENLLGKALATLAAFASSLIAVEILYLVGKYIKYGQIRNT